MKEGSHSQVIRDDRWIMHNAMRETPGSNYGQTLIPYCLCFQAILVRVRPSSVCARWGYSHTTSSSKPPLTWTPTTGFRNIPLYRHPSRYRYLSRTPPTPSSTAGRRKCRTTSPSTTSCSNRKRYSSWTNLWERPTLRTRPRQTSPSHHPPYSISAAVQYTVRPSNPNRILTGCCPPQVPWVWKTVTAVAVFNSARRKPRFRRITTTSRIRCAKTSVP